MQIFLAVKSLPKRRQDRNELPTSLAIMLFFIDKRQWYDKNYLADSGSYLSCFTATAIFCFL